MCIGFFSTFIQDYTHFFYFFLLKPKNTDIFIQIPLSVLSFSNILLGIC